MKWLVRSHIRKWSVPGLPIGLSITPSCNLLVTCQYPNKLVELSADSGHRVRGIALQSEIDDPWHSVQLTTGQLVVCHDGNLYHGVCVVGDDGNKVTRSYGSQSGSDVRQLYDPCHLAVDEDSQFIFVADRGDARVVLLSPTLEFVRHVSVPRPCGLYQATRRLFVSYRLGDVTVIQF